MNVHSVIPTPGSDAVTESSAPILSAMRDAASHARLWPIAVVVLVIDLWSKSWAFSSLGADEVYVVIPEWLVFRRSLNPGALFGMGPGLSSVFIFASIIALAFVIYLFANSDRRARSLHVALGLILAGALGNLYDRTFIIADVISIKGTSYRLVGIKQPSEDPDRMRLGSYPEGTPVQVFERHLVAGEGRQGVVRDFIKFEGRAFGVELWPWVFNVADSALVVGVSLLMLNFLLDARHRRVSATPTPHS